MVFLTFASVIEYMTAISRSEYPLSYLRNSSSRYRVGSIAMAFAKSVLAAAESITDAVGTLTVNLSEEEMQLPGNKAYQYINKHFKEKVTLGDVAKYAGLTPAALCRRFKQISGKSLFDYLSEVRIEFSYKLLAESTLPISMVAQEAGFQNVSHFNRVFKKLSGVTPKEYKRQHQRRI